MMKTLWNIVSFLAVVHLMALTLCLAWLWQSQRLSADRLHQARDLFALSVPEAQATAVVRMTDGIAPQLPGALDQRQAADHPMDSAAQIQQIALIKKREEQSRRQLLDQAKALFEQLGSASKMVEQKRAEFDAQRIDWENASQADRQRKYDQQFSQAVKQYERIGPKQGKKMIVELITQQSMNQAVAYLKAMDQRAASKILREFKTDAEIELATQLLEKLRTFTAEAAAPDRLGTPLPLSGASKLTESTNVNDPAPNRVSSR